MRSRTLAVALATVLVASLALPGAFAGPAVAQEDDDPSCSTEAVHDAFLTDDATIAAVNETGSASEIVQNTRVTVEESSAFYRIRAENPNSYCVHTTVKVSEEVLPPTNLGTVESTNEVTSATWTDVLDFDRQKAHTEISFTMPANSTVVFAPSKPTVLLPAWRDSRVRQAEGVLETVSSFFEDENLEKRTYQFEANNSPSVTVPLVNENNENQTITDWKAVYRTDSSEPWNPVDKNTDAPVFYQEVDDGDKVRFYFNDPNARVEFVANPTMRDEAEWQFRSFKRSIHDLTELLPFGSLAPATGWSTW